MLNLQKVEISVDRDVGNPLHVNCVDDLPLATELRLNVVPAVARDKLADTRKRRPRSGSGNLSCRPQLRMGPEAAQGKHCSRRLAQAAKHNETPRHWAYVMGRPFGRKKKVPSRVLGPKSGDELEEDTAPVTCQAASAKKSPQHILCGGWILFANIALE